MINERDNNNALKYQLSSAVIPREKWSNDETIKTCLNCEKEFIFILRRKHHCRRCGLVFCAE